MIEILIGSAAIVVIAWAAWRAGLLERGAVDRSEDGAQSERDVQRIVEATAPAPLERPHIRAGSAWGQQ